MKSDKPIGNVLKKIREDNNLTQKEFINKLNVNQSTYSNYENNRSNIPDSFLEKVGKTFNINIEEYINDFFNDYDNQENFLVGYKNPIEQLLFFNELSKARHYIDNIKDKRIRRKIATNFGAVLDLFQDYIEGSYFEFSNFDEIDLEKTEKEIFQIIRELLKDIGSLEENNYLFDEYEKQRRK